MIRVEMLPAAHGDCLWVEWGSDAEVFRMLVDGGPAHTYPLLLERILHLPRTQRVFELLVITHIDADHIEGIVRLLRDAESLNITFKRIWFNGRDELDRLPNRLGDGLGAVSGEYLGMLLHELESRLTEPVWNRDFDERIVRCDANDQQLPEVTLPGGLKLTILSPDLDRLHELDDVWDRELAKAEITVGNVGALQGRLDNDRRLRPLADELGAAADASDPDATDPDATDPDATDPDNLDDSIPEVALEDELGGGDGSDREFGDDSSAANGSSIAFLAEWDEGTSVLFAGDAFASVLQRSVERLLAERDKTRLQLDAFKLPHHGSVGNITEELLALLSCKAYLVSTSGVLFGHPHPGAIELLATHHNARGKPRFHFNYRSVFSGRFEAGKIADVNCVVHYPSGTSLSW